MNRVREFVVEIVLSLIVLVLLWYDRWLTKRRR